MLSYFLSSLANYAYGIRESGRGIALAVENRQRLKLTPAPKDAYLSFDLGASHPFSFAGVRPPSARRQGRNRLQPQPEVSTIFDDGSSAFAKLRRRT